MAQVVQFVEVPLRGDQWPQQRAVLERVVCASTVEATVSDFRALARVFQDLHPGDRSFRTLPGLEIALREDGMFSSWFFPKVS